SGNAIALSGSASFATSGLTNFDLGGSITTNNANQSFNSAITLTGDATLTSGSGTISLGGNVTGPHTFGLNTTQTGGFDQGSHVFNVTGLQLQGGNYALNNPANQIGTLAGNVGNLSLYDNASLTVGSPSTGITASGTVLLQTSADHDITLNQAIASSATGDAVVLASGGNFINNAGATAISLTHVGPEPKRFLIYSTDPAADTFGSSVLASGNAALWNTDYNATPPASVPGGNRYVYAYQPTVTFQGGTLTKTYGDDASAAVASAWSAAPYAGNGAGSAYVETNANIFSGAPAVTSAGAPASANVGNFAINVAPGSLSPLNGYAFAYADGLLTVNGGGLPPQPPQPPQPPPPQLPPSLPPSVSDPLQLSSGKGWTDFATDVGVGPAHPLSKLEYESLQGRDTLQWMESYLADTCMQDPSQINGLPEYNALEVGLTFDRYWKLRNEAQ
ncbi:MAG: hypothetical protein WCG35_00310, partial [Betaproteobacteria bacterium]